MKKEIYIKLVVDGDGEGQYQESINSFKSNSILNIFGTNCIVYSTEKRDYAETSINIVCEEVRMASKPKRTKVSYEEVSFDFLSEAAKAIELSKDYYLNDDGKVLMDEGELAGHFYKTGELTFYRKVETEITPMQAAKEACIEFLSTSSRVGGGSSFNSFRGDIHGMKVDDVWREEFVSMCRAIAKAYDKK